MICINANKSKKIAVQMVMRLYWRLDIKVFMDNDVFNGTNLHITF